MRPQLWRHYNRRQRAFVDPPEDWYDQVVVLWEEDDAHPPDAETAHRAIRRMAGYRGDREIVATYTPPDDPWSARLYADGWVLGYHESGGWVGVLIEGGAP